MPDACIIFSDLTPGYNSHRAVHHLNGVVRKGSSTAVVGANGSGRSTLMKGIVGVLKPMAGIRAVASGVKIAYAAQQSEPNRSFPARVVELVSLGLWPRRGLLGGYRPGDRQVVSNALSAVGLEGFEKRPVARGEARGTLPSENLLHRRRFHEAWDENAPWSAWMVYLLSIVAGTRVRHNSHRTA